MSADGHQFQHASGINSRKEADDASREWPNGERKGIAGDQTAMSLFVVWITRNCGTLTHVGNNLYRLTPVKANRLVLDAPKGHLDFGSNCVLRENSVSNLTTGTQSRRH